MTSPGAQLLGRDARAAGATAIVSFSSQADSDVFTAWAGRTLEAASRAPGFLSGQVGLVAATEFDWSISFAFDTEKHLHSWLDATVRRNLLAEGRGLGFSRISTDIVVVEGQTPGTGIGVFGHAVTAGKEAEFLAVQRRLLQLSASYPGFEGATLLPPGEGQNEWTSVVRFRTDHQLLAWLDSEDRRQALPTLRSQLSEDFSAVTRSTPFGSIVRIEDGATKVTPIWRSAMLVLLVLYPTVMTLSRFLGPVLDGAGAPPWLSMWLSQIVSVGLMSWLLMPAVTGWFSRWLDPVAGADTRATLIGVAVIVLVYIATLTLFASVPWLQFWTHPD